jgi:hypothetical protein
LAEASVHKGGQRFVAFIPAGCNEWFRQHAHFALRRELGAATIWSPIFKACANDQTSGLRVTKDSGPPSMMNSPPPGAGTRSLITLPPQWVLRSTSVMAAAGSFSWRNQAVLRPVMPPPSTTM